MSKFIKIYSKPFLVGCILIALLSFWVIKEKSASSNEAANSVYKSSKNIGDILRGVIISQYRCGRPERLEQILPPVLESSDIKYIILKYHNKVFLEMGKRSEFPQTNTKTGFKLFNKQFYYWDNFNLVYSTSLFTCSDSMMMKQEYLSPTKKNYTGTIFFGIRIQDKSYFKQIRDSNIKSMIIFLIGLIGILVLIFAWIRSIKSSKLKKELESTRQKAEQLKELNLAATGLAHETKNPLGIIRAIAQKLQSEYCYKNIAENKLIKKIIQEVDRTGERLSDFMNYASFRSVNKESVSLSDEVLNITELLQPDFELAGVKLTTDIDDIRIESDSEVFGQILVNLLQNSLNACSNGNSVNIKSENNGDFMSLNIKDNGCGISTELMKDIYKPYVKGRSKGHGIGLAIVKKFTENLGWEIKIFSEVDKGTTVVLENIKIL
ncbi:MAG TPA: HAMP domain-containing sensor histidine kinase [Victivallales bacterium]|nr:HAMP domain-containing sensor histidine kinase [Victivallales bacterium]